MPFDVPESLKDLITGTKATPVDADKVYFGNSEDGEKSVETTWTAIKDWFKTHFSNFFQPVFPGVNNPALFTVTYSHANRQFTVTYGAGAEVKVGGKTYPKAGSETTTAHAAVSGKYLLYYDSNGNLTVSTIPWDFLNTAQLRVLYYSAVKGASILMLDAHPSTTGMSAAAHRYNHKYTGTRFGGGGAVTQATIPSGNVLSEIQYAVSKVYFADEDIDDYESNDMPKLGTSGQTIRIFYRAEDGSWTWDDTSTTGLLHNGTNFYANVFTGGNWTLAAQSTNARWVNYFLGVIPDEIVGNRLFAVMGQTVHTSLAAAQAEDPSTGITGWSEFASEHVFFKRMTYERKGSGNTFNASLASAQTITSNNSTSNSPTSYPAASVTTTGSQNTVQAYLDYLEGMDAPIPYANGTVDANFTIDPANGLAQTVTIGNNATTGITMAISNPAVTTRRIYLETRVTRSAGNQRVVTLTGGNIISSGGQVSSGKTLPSDGASTVAWFQWMWSPASSAWILVNALFDIKA